MKIFIACSKWSYWLIPEIKKELELLGHEIILPNFFDDPLVEERIKKEMTIQEHQDFCRESFKISRQKSEESDVILVLNVDKEKDGSVLKNYIGGATFLEMYDSYLLGHPIYLYNPIPQGMLYDEIEGMCPIIINQNLNKIETIKKN